MITASPETVELTLLKAIRNIAKLLRDWRIVEKVASEPRDLTRCLGVIHGLRCSAGVMCRALARLRGRM